VQNSISHNAGGGGISDDSDTALRHGAHASNDVANCADTSSSESVVRWNERGTHAAHILACKVFALFPSGSCDTWAYRNDENDMSI